MINYAEISKRMMDILGLKYEPVAVTFIKKGEAIPTGFNVVEAPTRHCQSVMRARKGEMVIVPAAKQACPVGASALGMVPTPEKVRSGEFHHNAGLFETSEAAAKTIACRPEMEAGSTIAMAVAPLSKTTLVPDVIIVTGTPEQIYWIVPAAATYQEGGRVNFEMGSAQASCADSTVLPYLTKRINVSLGCFGCRRSTDIAPEEMFVGIPAEKIETLVASLEKLGVGPIAKAHAK